MSTCLYVRPGTAASTCPTPARSAETGRLSSASPAAASAASRHAPRVSGSHVRLESSKTLPASAEISALVKPAVAAGVNAPSTTYLLASTMRWKRSTYHS